MSGKIRKRIYSLLVCCILIHYSVAQDVIYLADASRVECKIMDIEGPKLKYKNLQNLDGPDYLVPRERVSLIFFEDGSHVVMDAIAQGGMRTFPRPIGDHDRIYFADHKMELGNVISVEKGMFKYRRASMLDGPIFSKRTSDIGLVLYRDGRHQLFGNPVAAATAIVANQESVRIPSSPPPNNIPKVNPKTVVERPSNDRIPQLADPVNESIEHTSVEQLQPVSAQQTQIADRPESIERDVREEVRDDIPDSESSGIIRDLDIDMFRAKALQKTNDLGMYFSIIADKQTDWQEANKAIDLAVDLFVDEEARVEVGSLSRADKKKYPIRRYLERLKLLKYDKVEITWTEVNYVSNLRKGLDGNYYGVISFLQKFTGYRDNRLIYSDYTRKNIEVVLKGYTKLSGGEQKELWDVFLSDIGVINMK